MALLALARPVQAEVTTGDVNLRAGPGTRHRILAVVPRGTGVAVHECTTRRSWCRISWRARTGWISARYLDNSLPGVGRSGYASGLPGYGTTVTIQLAVRPDYRPHWLPEYGSPIDNTRSRDRPWLFGPDRQWRALQQKRAVVQYQLSK
ncbi:MAG: SH3 domain-containing protein [Salaquimonas sp.]|nr:SH3 domain-containing protein [Salaquimonas sp.]